MAETVPGPEANPRALDRSAWIRPDEPPLTLPSCPHFVSGERRCYRARMLRRALLAALLALAACAAPPAAGPTTPTRARPAPPGGPHPVQPSPVASADPAACAAKGGTVRPVCRLQRPMCVIPFADAGRACTDGDQCQGDCRTEGPKPDATGPVTGRCQADTDPCGCWSNVEDGQLVGGLCVD